MSAFTEADLRQRGFVGFEPFVTLDVQRVVPDTPGVYIVLASGSPEFLPTSPAGPFRGDPSVPVEVLKARWLIDAETVYIGKAAASLRRRTNAYRAHGLGTNARHWGGRYLWQVAGLNLLLGWRECEHPRDVEQSLLAEFEARFGALPFANLVH